MVANGNDGHEILWRNSSAAETFSSSVIEISLDYLKGGYKLFA